MKKKILAVLLVGIVTFSLVGCDMALLGKWSIKQVTAGDVVMTQEDIVDMGLDVGYIKLNNSGSCKLNLLGDEYEGNWTASGEGAVPENVLTISYGDGLQGTANFDENKQMTFADAQGSEYILSK